jgi:hypothetical protein
MAAPPPVQLLLYGFGPDAEFEGRLVGALERLESGGALKILDALFVHRLPEGGELEIVNLKGDGAGGIAAPLLEFRLDAAARKRATQKALAGRPGGIPPEVLKRVGNALEPGAALAAVLVDHAWRRALEDAVERSAGTPLVSDFVDATKLAELEPERVLRLGQLVEVAAQPRDGA